MSSNILTMIPTISFFWVIMIFFSLSASAACNVKDKKALLAFKNSFPANTFPTWNSTDCCSWDFVQCSLHTGRVTSLQFWGGNDVNTPPPSVDLKGSIPESVGNLPFLENLYFIGLNPGLVGPIPPQLTKLTKLQTLAIMNTGISGPIPSFLSQLASLEDLLLASNKFSGPIPPALGSLVNLVALDLSRNQLTGSIPSTLIHSSTLDLSGNKLTGPIPRSFANVSSFSLVNLENNQLTGDASPFFGRSKTISNIILFNNKLSFDLSKVEYPESLMYVDMSHNRIYGRISDQILQAASILTFDVSYNKLCGKIPGGGRFAQFQGAQYFAHNMCLCGPPLKQPCKQ